jgi:hypothetical protein
MRFCSLSLTCRVIDAWMCNFRELSAVQEPWG